MSGMLAWLVETTVPDELGHAIHEYVDAGVRHKSGATPTDFLKSFLRVSRELGYATRDDSWNEFEKEFTIIVMRAVMAEARLRIVDPTYFDEK